MSTYLEQKIAEALNKSKGNHMRAAVMLEEMAARDEVLYAGLTNPLLPMAATLAIQKFLSHQRQMATSARRASKITDLDLDKMITQMANNPSRNDFLSPQHTKAKAGSVRHTDSMQRIADAFAAPRRPKPKKP